MEAVVPNLSFGEIQWLTPRWLFILLKIRIGILRIWEQDKVPGIKNKNEYTWACTVQHISNKEIELLGVDKAPSIYVFKEIIKTLSAEGYTTGTWIRINTDKERIIKFSPKRK
jgi:hypothetical protein